MSVKEGDLIPALTVPSDGGGSVTLGASGRYTLLYFYPKDDTPGCTVEAHEFSALKPDFEAEGADLFGASKDDVESHDKFKAKHCIAFPLLSDGSGELCETFGVWVEKSMFGKPYMGVERATFLLSPERVVLRAWRKVSPKGHAQETLDALREEKRKAAA